MKFSLKKPTIKKADAKTPPVLSSAETGKKKAVTDPGRAKKTFRPSPGAKYNLIIGDDGAILIYMVGKAVKSRHFVGDAGTENLKELRAILEKDPKAPLFMIIDSMDQTFVQQTLPPISAMSVGKLIKRRLDRDLPADAIKGSVLLEREKTGRKDWNFLMISLEKSPQLTVWLEFVENVDNRLKGIYLLSVETENLLKHLDRAIGLPKEGTGSRWKFFVSHNKVGGFRQVILKDGRIIFTRLSQPVGEATPEIIAGNIEQEMLSTIEYMKRLSYNAQDGLDIYIIASAEIKSALDTDRLLATHFYSFTPFAVAEYLGIEGATQPSDQFGDVILAASIGGARKHVLTLSTPTSRKVEQLYNFILYERVGAALLLLCIVGYVGLSVSNIFTNYLKAEELADKKEEQQKNYDALQQEIKNNHIDVKKINEIVELYKQLGTEVQSPLSVLARLSEAIKFPVRLKQLTWELNESGKPDAAAPAPAPAVAAVPPGVAPAAPTGPQMAMTAVLRFPDIVSTQEAYKTISKKVLADVKAALPGYSVEYTVIPEEFKEKETQDITFDDRPPLVQPAAKKTVEATMKITGASVFRPPAAAPAPMPNPAMQNPLVGPQG